MKKYAKDYLANYVTPDGGGKLNPNDMKEPFEGCPFITTKNENPILFFVQSAIEILKYEPEYFEEFRQCYERHMRSTQVQGHIGLHSRRCGDWTIRRQSHDNLVAILIGGWYFRSDFQEKVFLYGQSVGWNYNVMTPGKIDIKSQIQGGDIALAHYATARRPELWHILWLAVGLAISKTWNLADLRITFLEQIMSGLSVLERLLLIPAITIHKIRRGPRLKWVQQYFGGSQYPFKLLLEERENDKGHD